MRIMRIVKVAVTRIVFVASFGLIGALFVWIVAPALCFNFLADHLNDTNIAAMSLVVMMVIVLAALVTDAVAYAFIFSERSRPHPN